MILLLSIALDAFLSAAIRRHPLSCLNAFYRKLSESRFSL